MPQFCNNSMASHTYHIPVMGTAFTAETPLRVAQYGINSVIALADDVLLERLRKIYSERHHLSYSEITLHYITIFIKLMFLGWILI